MKRDAFLEIRRLFDANKDGGGGAGGVAGQGDPDDGAKTDGDDLTWDGFYGGLDDKTKKVVDGHVSGLRSALDKERADRKGLDKQIKDLQGKAEKGSEMETQLNALNQQLEESNRKSAFMDGAIKNGVGNPGLAYLAAKEAGAFDTSGNVNWERLKELHPELFKEEKKAGGQRDAGGGSNTNQPGSDMNSMLRSAAGRG